MSILWTRKPQNSITKLIVILVHNRAVVVYVYDSDGREF